MKVESFHLGKYFCGRCDVCANLKDDSSILPNWLKDIHLFTSLLLKDVGNVGDGERKSKCDWTLQEESPVRRSNCIQFHLQ